LSSPHRVGGGPEHQNLWHNNSEHSDVSYMSNAAKSPAKEDVTAETKARQLASPRRPPSWLPWRRPHRRTVKGEKLAWRVTRSVTGGDL